MTSERVMMISMEMKLEEMTVTRQSSQPRAPTIIHTEMAQVSMGSRTQRLLRKNNHMTTIINVVTAMPNTTRSFSMNAIMSEVIIGTPPRKISAPSR